MTKQHSTADEILHDLVEPIEAASQEQPSSTQLNTYVGIAQEAFPSKSVEVLMAPVNTEDIEIRPDGLIYLPEIKYRRILNRAFGPGAWSLMPIEITVSTDDNMLYYRGALFVHGRFVSEAIGEQQYYPESERMSYGTAAESAKSNCLMRCCKDLGIASELWDPSFVRRWLKQNAVEVWCSNVSRDASARGRKRKMWRKRTDDPIDSYPWREESVPRSEAAEPVSAASRPAVASDERQSIEAKAAPPEPVVVSFKQSRRFSAIAREHKWSAEEIACLLGRYGYRSAEEIHRADYDRICAALADQTMHIATREAVASGTPLPRASTAEDIQALPL